MSNPKIINSNYYTQQGIICKYIYLMIITYLSFVYDLNKPINFRKLTAKPKTIKFNVKLNGINY